MDLSSACESVGGRPRGRNICVLGRNVIQKVDDFRYNIITPVTTITVRSAAVKVKPTGLLFLFNNCGLEVGKERIDIRCFAPGKDNDLSVYIDEVFNAVI